MEMPIRSRFKLLLAEKELDERRRIPYREIREATGISESAISKLATNTTQRYDADILAALCGYFQCGVGDLLEYIPDGNGDAVKRGRIKKAS